MTLSHQNPMYNPGVTEAPGSYRADCPYKHALSWVENRGRQVIPEDIENTYKFAFDASSIKPLGWTKCEMSFNFIGFVKVSRHAHLCTVYNSFCKLILNKRAMIGPCYLTPLRRCYKQDTFGKFNLLALVFDRTWPMFRTDLEISLRQTF